MENGTLKIRNFLVLARLLGFLYKKKRVYYAVIYPFLLYGIMIWGNTSLTLLNPIHIQNSRYCIQKKFVRMATYKDGYPLIPELSFMSTLPHTSSFS